MTSISTEEIGDVLAVTLAETKILDEAKIQQIGNELMDVPRRAISSKVLLDFRGVQFMSSGMIGKIIQLNKKCKADNVNLKLCNISPNVLEVFTIMKLTKVLSIYDDREKALAAFEKKGWFS
jgi:anti-sigma B factor antagonist